MRFVGGEAQELFVELIRGVDPGQCLLVPVDVGKATAMALVADLYGEVVVDPFGFELTESGVSALLGAVTRAEAERGAVMVRVGIEAAGRYHRTLMASLGRRGLEVVELNPAAVAEARSGQGKRRLKSDIRDLAAMADLLARGAGRAPQRINEPMAIQAAWAGHRRRKLKARVALQNQVIGQLDVVFPGLTGCFRDLLETKAGRVIVHHIPEPARIRRLGIDGLRRFLANRGCRITRPKAAQVMAAAQDALRLDEAEHAAAGAVLAADVVLLATVEGEVQRAEEMLSSVLDETPAGVLSTLPGVGVVRASNYGAALGDPHRFGNAAAAYRFSGLVPTDDESAGRRRPGRHITREGSVELREAIIELGRGLAGHEPDFATYKANKLAAGKKRGVAAVAVGRRAHRLAFAMMRDQTRYESARWAERVAAGRSVMAQTRNGTATAT
ncbi:MAG: IS110 family transposase [Planctomycetota bacterium]